MTEDSAGTAVHDKPTDPIRLDDEGNPVYADWDDSWVVKDLDESSPAGQDSDEWVVEYEPSNEIVYQPPEEVRAEVARNWEAFRQKVVSHHFDPESLMDGVEKIYSTSKAAKFFGRSNQWMYWGLREGIFTYKNGDPILPERIGKGGRRRFTLPLIREIALSCYRRGNVSEEELQDIMRKILLAEFGSQAFADTA